MRLRLRQFVGGLVGLGMAAAAQAQSCDAVPPNDDIGLPLLGVQYVRTEQSGLQVGLQPGVQVVEIVANEGDTIDIFFDTSLTYGECVTSLTVVATDPTVGLTPGFGDSWSLDNFLLNNNALFGGVASEVRRTSVYIPPGAFDDPLNPGAKRDLLGALTIGAAWDGLAIIPQVIDIVQKKPCRCGVSQPKEPLVVVAGGGSGISSKIQPTFAVDISNLANKSCTFIYKLRLDGQNRKSNLPTDGVGALTLMPGESQSVEIDVVVEDNINAQHASRLPRFG